MSYSSSPATSLSDRTLTIFVAVELSCRSWLVALHAPDAAKVELHRLPAGDGTYMADYPRRKSCRPPRHNQFFLRPVRLVSDPCMLEFENRCLRRQIRSPPNPA
jgi:hypothetical protein